MPDKRLIDANALLKRIAHHTVHDSLKRITFEAANTYEQVKGDMFNLVQKAPVVDAVEVVRCRDCIYASTTKFSSKRVACAYWAQMVSADGYCSNGVTEGKYNGNG